MIYTQNLFGGKKKKKIGDLMDCSVSVAQKNNHWDK